MLGLSFSKLFNLSVSSAQRAESLVQNIKNNASGHLLDTAILFLRKETVMNTTCLRPGDRDTYKDRNVIYHRILALQTRFALFHWNEDFKECLSILHYLDFFAEGYRPPHDDDSDSDSDNSHMEPVNPHTTDEQHVHTMGYGDPMNKSAISAKLIKQCLDSINASDLQEAISQIRDMLAKLFLPASERPSLLISLAELHMFRYLKEGRQDLRNRVSTPLLEALALLPLRHPQRQLCLMLLSTINGSPTSPETFVAATDLEAALEFVQKAQEEDEEGCDAWTMADEGIKDLEWDEDLECFPSRPVRAAIEWAQRSLELRPAPHIHRLDSVHALALGFEAASFDIDVGEFIPVLRDVRDLFPLFDPRRPAMLNSYARALFQRYMEEGNVPDLLECTSLLNEAFELAPNIRNLEEKTQVLLYNLSLAYSKQYEANCNLQDLEMAISIGRKALALIKTLSYLRPYCLTRLAASLRYRFECHQKMATNSNTNVDLSDLDESIVCLRGAVELLDSHDAQFPFARASLASGFLRRFQTGQNLEDLNQAIDQRRLMVEAGDPDEDPQHYPIWLQKLACFLLVRFTCCRHPADLEEGQRLLMESTQLLQLPDLHDPQSKQSAAVYTMAHQIQKGLEDGQDRMVDQYSNEMADLCREVLSYDIPFSPEWN